MDSSLIELLKGAGLDDLTGKGGPPHFFIAKMMAENKRKHKGQYRYSTTLPRDTTMNAPVVFEYKKLANAQQSPIGENPREYGASPFITKHFGTDEAVPFIRKRPPKPPYQPPPPRPERQVNPKWWNGYDKGEEVLDREVKALQKKRADKKAKLDARIAREIELGIRDPSMGVSSSSSSVPISRPLVPPSVVRAKIPSFMPDRIRPIPEGLEGKYDDEEVPARASSSSSSSSSTPMGDVLPDKDERAERRLAKLKAEIDKRVREAKERAMEKKAEKDAEKEAKKAKNEEIRAKNEEIRAKKADKALKERRNEIKEIISRNNERIRELNKERETASKEEKKRINEEGLALNESTRALKEEKDKIDSQRGK